MAGVVLSAAARYKVTCIYPDQSYNGKEVTLINFDTDKPMGKTVVAEGKAVIEGDIEGS